MVAKNGSFMVKKFGVLVKRRRFCFFGGGGGGVLFCFSLSLSEQLRDYCFL
jgi:hypothetical protein